MDSPPPLSPPTSSSERRAEYRRPLRTRVVLVLSDGRLLQGKAFDVGAGGLGVVIDKSLPNGTVCNLSFSLLFNNGSTYAGKAQAKVAYCVLSATRDGFKTGLQFAKLSTEGAAAVKRYLDA